MTPNLPRGNPDSLSVTHRDIMDQDPTPPEEEHREPGLAGWARARMAPESWERLQRASHSYRSTLDASVESGRRWASIGSDQVTSMREARADPWRLIFAAGTIV